MENKIKNSETYINSVFGKKTGFSAPKNYFNDLEEHLETKLSEDNFAKESGFSAPDRYFKNLEKDILTKVKSTKKVTKVISFKERFLKMMPIIAAASVILFIALNSFVFSNKNKITIDALSDTDIEYWLDSNTFNTNDIAAVLQDDILIENDFYFTTLEDENIEDYINSIDNTLLLSELNEN
ncbi:hypothetical protein [uncultured Polaribacter sp.]|uniref:hypothetical protein n=1 Tax=uncultured Polaribacter sp. TaxID=174711 RepID=UPI0026122665|nr:hypothetical protein [uncultured Polaribacter sp.]